VDHDAVLSPQQSLGDKSRGGATGTHQRGDQTLTTFFIEEKRLIGRNKMEPRLEGRTERGGRESMETVLTEGGGKGGHPNACSSAKLRTDTSVKGASIAGKRRVNLRQGKPPFGPRSCI
jgi:hypothetical protein